MKIVTWNLERKKPTTPTGAAGVARLAAEKADIIVLTEARTSHLEESGFRVDSGPPVWPYLQPDEREVLMWSPSKWTDVDTVGHERLLPGGFVSAITETELGPIRFIGLCIPWHMMKTEHESKAKPWKYHIEFCEILRELLDQRDRSLPHVLAGDFNQAIPRIRYGNHAAAAALEAALHEFDVVTQGTIPGCAQPGIDHIAIDAHLRADSVHGWPKNDGGVLMSDHDAAVAELTLAT